MRGEEILKIICNVNTLFIFKKRVFTLIKIIVLYIILGFNGSQYLWTPTSLVNPPLLQSVVIDGLLGARTIE